MKIQNGTYKNLLWAAPRLLFVAIFFINFSVLAQTVDSALLQKADALYADKHYTESFQLYEQLYREKKMFTPAMLLKMAFIQEGLGEYSQTLYYLNEYYLQTSDKRAVEKMQQLSQKYDLQGYQYDDYDIFLNFVRKYRYIILYSIIVLAMGGLLYFAFNRKKYQEKPYGLGITYVILLGLLFVMTNYSFGTKRAIITTDNAYIMDGPSAGAKVLSVSNKGDRVKIAGQEDVWTKIRREDGKEAFIRQNNLRFIEP